MPSNTKLTLLQAQRLLASEEHVRKALHALRHHSHFSTRRFAQELFEVFYGQEEGPTAADTSAYRAVHAALLARYDVEALHPANYKPVRSAFWRAVEPLVAASNKAVAVGAK